jgi:hypothetical protein
MEERKERECKEGKEKGNQDKTKQETELKK